jgi:hypothetical protein
MMRLTWFLSSLCRLAQLYGRAVDVAVTEVLLPLESRRSEWVICVERVRKQWQMRETLTDC